MTEPTEDTVTEAATDAPVVVAADPVVEAPVADAPVVVEATPEVKEESILEKIEDAVLAVVHAVEDAIEEV